MTAKGTPRNIDMTIALMRNEAVGQHALRLNHADAATVFAGSRMHVVAQLVAVADHRQVHAEILDRVIAGVGHQIVDAVGRNPEYETNDRLAELPAVTFSGRTGASALMIRSIIILHWVNLASAAAGNFGLNIEPSGAMTVIGRKEPWFDGTGTSIVSASSRSARKAQ